MITTLSATATPGKRYSFASPAGPEQHTALSVMATPGGLRTFTPKGPSGAEQITDLAVWAIPGKRRFFTAKSPYVPPEPPVIQVGGGGTQLPTSHRAQILREDEEIIAVIMAFMETRH